MAYRNNRTRLFDDNIAKIRAKLPSNLPKDVAFISAYLRWIAVWYGQNGAATVLQGNGNGWKDISRSAQYAYWFLRTMVHLYDNDSNPNKASRASVNQGALCFAHLLAIGRDAEARWLGERVTRSFSDGALGNWAGTPFEPFMAHLYVKWAGGAVANLPSRQKLGVYGELLDSWQGSREAIQTTLLNACDYHVLRSRADENGFPEFAQPLYEIFPAEILAVTGILGFSRDLSSLPQHPLMSTPMALPPAHLPIEEDALLLDVVQKIKSVFPAV